jgi:small subunit ribosomal protein S7
MARGARKIVHNYEPDTKYGHVLIGRFINKIMLDGKKTIAERIVHTALETAAKKLGKEPVEVFDTVVRNVSPSVQLKARRMGGANLQVPTEVSADRRIVIALRWIVAVARSRKGKPMAEKLAQELIDAYNNTGDAVRKKEETHRMAEANQAFAHFARF